MAGDDDDDDVVMGATLIARSLKEQGVEYMFGIVGIPVVPIAMAAMAEGIRFIACRNEQAASYGAGIVGYLTGRPGCCLVVSGPGVIHVLAGAANNQSNCWPMICLGGANDAFQDGMEAFQELKQVEAARQYCKYSERPDQLARVPYYVEQAVRTSIYGRPGAVYLDLPANIINGKVLEKHVVKVKKCPDPPKVFADPTAIKAAVQLLKTAERPLIIVGKGAQYSRAEEEVQKLISLTNLPYLPTPMGKGLVPDDHQNSVAAARSQALLNADVILLIGCRLNWMLHFGMPPRFQPNVKTIQIDIFMEEMHHNIQAEVALVGDCKSVVNQINQEIQLQQASAGANEKKFYFGVDRPWWKQMHAVIKKNNEETSQMAASNNLPMGYYRIFAEIQKNLPRDAMIVAEGSNTMDISRSCIPNYLPRSRLDAGTFGTMGVGLGFALASAVCLPNRKTVVIQGDSAFGFSAMEIETACRYKLPICIIIFNNNGITSGLPELDPDSDPLPNCLTPDARYEMMATAFGGKGYSVSTPEDLSNAVKEALTLKVPTIINVHMDNQAGRKQQEFAWLSTDNTVKEKKERSKI